MSEVVRRLVPLGWVDHSISYHAGPFTWSGGIGDHRMMESSETQSSVR